MSRLAVVRLYGEGFLQTTRVLQQALRDAEADDPLRVQISITLAYCLLHSNAVEESLRTAELAVSDAERLGQPHLLSMALGMRVTLQFLSGGGLDDVSLSRAVELEDPKAFTPLVFRPSVQHALLMEWTGELDRARETLDAIRLRCIENGEEGEYVFLAQHVVMSSVWRGDFVKAELVAEDAMERARQLGGNTPLFLANSLRALVAVYAGQEAEARRAVADALEIGRRTGTFRLAERVLAALAFLEVSLGNYEAAVTTLRPVLSSFDPESTPTELPSAGFLPDAIEALVQLGRHAEAEPLIDRARAQRPQARPRLDVCGRRALPSHAAGGPGRPRWRPRSRTGGDDRARGPADAVRAGAHAAAVGPARASTTQEGVGIGQPAGGARHLRAAATSRCGPTGPAPNWSARTSGHGKADSSRRPSSGSPNSPRRV